MRSMIRSILRAIRTGTDQCSASDAAFFAALREPLSSAPQAVRVDVDKHLSYLAGRAGVTVDHLLEGKSFSVHPQVLQNAITNISKGMAAANRAAEKAARQIETYAATDLSATGAIPADVLSIVERAESKLEGWCSREKAAVLVNLVLREKPEICVEIGVYGGRSLVPCAAALRHNGSGHIYGIETWRPDVATEYAHSEENDAWWRALDFPLIKREFVRFIADHDLSWQIRLVEAPAADAAVLFGPIDFLHIDGAHSVYNAAEDVVLYLKKLKRGGIVILDDIDWTTTAPAYDILKALCDPVVLVKNEASGVDGCAVLRKR
jgi:predicted O-methyltransferase YrrM